MSTHLITGFAGKEHITSADQGSFNAAVMGGGEFVLERGEQFRCQVISNNKVRIYDGDALMQGRHIIIDRNTYEETTHENGTQGYKRIDLIVLTYEKNAVTSVETVKLEVIKGLPSESNPVVPEYTTGDILNSGASKNQMPLYQIPFDGLSIGEPVKLFSTVPTLETMKKEVDDEVDAKKEELDEKFKSMIASNADDWGMIENYGEFAADAKTVNESLAKFGDEVALVSGAKDVSQGIEYETTNNLNNFKGIRIAIQYSSTGIRYCESYVPISRFKKGVSIHTTYVKPNTSNMVEYVWDVWCSYIDDTHIKLQCNTPPTIQRLIYVYGII